MVMLFALWSESLLAQESREAGRPAPLPVLQTIGFDLTAALQGRWQVSLEPLVFGRVALGLTAGQTTTPERRPLPVYPIYVAGRELVDILAPCPLMSGVHWPYHGCGYYPPTRPRYRASELSLRARWYPAAWSRDRDRQRYGIYIGEFLSYNVRRIELPQTSWRNWPPIDPYTPPDSAYPMPIPTIGPGWVQRLRGWEPGAEIGARVLIGGRVILDFGSSVRIVTLDDPLSALRPGQADARFVLLVGVSW